jgi:hypothetical protein
MQVKVNDNLLCDMSIIVTMSHNIIYIGGH